MKITGKNNFTESEGIFRSIFENSGEAILITHPGDAIYSANPEACRLLGMSEAEICKLGRNGIIDTTDGRLSLALKERSLTGKFKGELTLIRKDGTKFPAEVTNTVFRDAAGDERTAMIIRDISQHKQVEMELHLQSEIMKNISEGINMVRQNDNIIVFTNPKFDELFGYETGELIGKNVGILNAPTSKKPEKIKQDIIDILNITGEWHGEILNVKKNGNLIWCYANISKFIHHGYGMVYLSVHSDITIRKQAETDIKESESRLLSIFENSLIGISTASPEGKLLNVNSAYANMYGFESPEQMLSEVTNVVTLFAYPDQRKEILIVLNKECSMDAREIEVVRRDGSHFFVHVSAAQIKDADGKVLYNQETHIDQTERKINEEEIRKSKDMLENLNQHLLDVWENEKAQIALNIHDDLGQKLTALNMDLAWVKSRMGVQSHSVLVKLKEMRRDIIETVEEIKEISSFLRPSILFDLGVISAINSQIERFNKQSGISCKFFHEPAEFEIDEKLSLVLYRIVQESFTNIARHSHAKNVEINLKKKRNNIELLIIDDGIGISKEQINSISSMGLAGMRERVWLFKGSLKIQGKKALGTKVFVTIPFKKIT